MTSCVLGALLAPGGPGPGSQTPRPDRSNELDLYDPASLASGFEEFARVVRQPRVAGLRDEIVDHFIEGPGAVAELEKRGGARVQLDGPCGVHEHGLRGRRACLAPL